MKAGGVIIKIFFVIVVMLLFGVFIINRMMNSTMPVYNGELVCNEIKENADIYRDSCGIAYIVAGNEYDAAFSLGYVHAEERYFQMDLYRRAASGRLSEMFGEETLDFDIMFRTIGLQRYVDDNYSRLDDYTKQMLEAYTRGVNYYLKVNGNKAAPELDLLNEIPEKWKPQDSYLINRFMGWMLNLSWWTDIAYAHIINRYGVTTAADIIPDFTPGKSFDYSYLKKVDDIGERFYSTDKQFREFIGFEGSRFGSNNWVVNGKKTVSGKPMIANDPHLPLTLPNIWYTAVIKSPEWDVAGVTIPGAPGVVIGNNENISWTYTNLMVDDCDFFVEELDNTGKYYNDGGDWQKLDMFSDTIKVKSAKDTVINVGRTNKGPIISDIHTYNFTVGRVDTNSVLSMRWTGYEFSNEINATLKLNKASTKEEFIEAASGFSTPGMNLVYADREGNIGYLAAAKIPVRRNFGKIIYDGKESRNNWSGFYDYKDLPKVLNPDENFIASANNKSVANFGFYVGNIWEPESRINRINYLLRESDSITPDYVKQMQRDIVTDLPETIVKHLLESFENTQLTNDNLVMSIELLKQWDFSMHKDDQAPLLFNIFKMKLLENILLDELGSKMFEEYVFLSNVPDRMLVELMADRYNTWYDNTNTPEIEDRNLILRKSLIDALEFLEKNVSLRIEEWQWYKLHKLTLKHPFSGKWKLLDKLIDVGPFEISGEGTTIYCSGYSVTDPFDVRVGQSMRYIYDFSTPEFFWFAMPGGQSGNFMNEHYDDMMDYYMNDHYIKVPLKIEDIENSGFELLRLKK